MCKGKRYNRETLEVKYKGKNIHDVLNMTVDEGLAFFANLPKLRRKLETLSSVGLGYLKIGQSSTTLSGGEAQRVKLATELSRRSTGKTIYILDEPTTVFTPTMCASFWRCSSGWWIMGTLWLSSNITWTSLNAPTTSLT